MGVPPAKLQLSWCVLGPLLNSYSAGLPDPLEEADATLAAVEGDCNWDSDDDAGRHRRLPGQLLGQ